MPDLQTGGPSRRLIILAAALAVALAAVVAILGVMNRSSNNPGDEQLALVPVPASQADSPQCAALVPALPAELISNGATLNRRVLAEPAPPATVAWGAPDPIVLRCGLDRPPELTRTAQLRVVSGVQWLPVEGDGASTWYVVDREVYVGLTVPDSAGTGPLQSISDTVASTLRPAPLRF
ncbi:DUF3515 domain-containing protein [Amycolatopsis pithecellobii]|uniref:DUF3515 family protein n=1 Tax=Amycolatopsis pithecellobii TaxID=664692 RepID=A0A6N7YTW3_9PSEU|nr:DUF3515 domain-containing protein [Amycolatopsis pithecellobii]MTD55372.1 DUF3515 family protein [Amycolatopsis pithecellobii]